MFSALKKGWQFLREVVRPTTVLEAREAALKAGEDFEKTKMQLRPPGSSAAARSITTPPVEADDQVVSWLERQGKVVERTPAAEVATSIAEQRAAEHVDFEGTREASLGEEGTLFTPLKELPDKGEHVLAQRKRSVQTGTEDRRSLLERAMATREGDNQLTQSVSPSRR